MNKMLFVIEIIDVLWKLFHKNDKPKKNKV